MTNSQRLAMVRACLTRWLKENRESETQAPHSEAPNHGVPFSESILVRDQFYCGRRFDAGSHRAVWFLEEDELKISTGTGQLLCVLSGAEITEMASRPAAGEDEPPVESADVLPLRAVSPETTAGDNDEQVSQIFQTPQADSPGRRAA